MINLFARRDFLGNRLSVWVVVAMAFVAPLCVASIRHLTLANPVEKLLPDNDPELLAAEWADKQFSIDEKIVLTWEDSSINDPRVGKLIEELSGTTDERGIRRGGSPYVSSVASPIDALSTMEKNGIPPREAVYRLTGSLIGAGPLRLQLTEVGRSALRKTKREIQTAVKSHFGFDMTIQDASPDLSSLVSIPSFANAGEASNTPSPPAVLSIEGKLTDKTTIEHDLQVSWPGMRIGSDSTVAVLTWLKEYIPPRSTGEALVDNAFFAPGSPIALQIGLSEAGRIEPAEAVAAIRSASARVGIDHKALHLSGKSVTDTAVNSEIEHTAWNTLFPFLKLHLRSPLLVAAMICAALTLFLVRNIRPATMVLLITAFTTLCSIAIFPFTGSPLSLALIVSAILIAAYTLQSAIGFAENWKMAAVDAPATAVTEAAALSSKTIWASGATVLAGLLGLCAGGSSPLREFGFSAAIGVILASVLVAIGLPSLVQALPEHRTKRSSADRNGWRLFGTILTSYPGLQSLALIAIFACGAFGLSKCLFESTVRQLNSQFSKDAQYIETLVTGGLPVETIVRFDQQSQRETSLFQRLELIRRIEQELRANSQISGTLSLASFQQPAELLPEDASFAQKNKFHKRANAVQQQYVEGTILPAKSYYQMAAKTNVLQVPTIVMLNESGDELWRISSRIVSGSSKDYSTVTANINRVAQDVLKLYPGSRHRVTGSVPVELQTYHVSARSLIVGSIVSVLLMTIVSMIAVRSLGGGLLFLLTGALPVVAVFGGLSWAKQPIDIKLTLTGMIALVMGAQGVVQFVLCLHQLKHLSLTRRETIIAAFAQSRPSIAQTVAIFGFAFMAFNFAESAMIDRMGLASAIAIGAMALGQIVLLPQIAAGPLGRILIAESKSIAISANQTSTIEPVIEQPSEPTIADLSIPDPHIKPIDHSAAKRRRASTRKARETD